MEKLNPKNHRQYWYKGSWHDMEVRRHSFKVRGKSTPVVHDSFYTVHGPVFSMGTANNVAFSKRLSCKETFLQGFAAFYNMMKAETLEQFYRTAQLGDMSINCFFANTEGDIAYYHLGLHPIRTDGYDIRLPVPGTGEFEWQGFLPKTDNPHVHNPKKGYIVNWNNQPAPGWGHADLATSDVWGGWGRDDRVMSLIRLVEACQPISPDDIKGFIKEIAFYDKRTIHIKDLMVGDLRLNKIS